ncbi:MAG: HAMP domain-containing sensor histidine kinase [Cyclobacteriaceae bacterium]|nr:HAMP domain-containing sensor histidine kinase [Cytophagales bacterium]MCZ8328661.1 HAMP domain-containing sensor histidine kinase [Cyclobacteriaceae bacterium]
MTHLEVREELFRELAHHSAVVTIITDNSFTVRYASHTASVFFTCETILAIGKEFFDFIEPNQIANWKEAFFNFKINGHTNHTPESILLKNKSKVYAVEMVYLPAGSEQSNWMIRLSDVTEQQLKEESLLKTTEHFDQIFYKTTHDLKAPIRSALGLLNLAENTTEEQRTEYLQLIRANLLKLDSFLDELNDFFSGNRLEVKREPIDFNKIAEEELKFVSGLAEHKQISISLDVSQKSTFHSDIFRVKTILTNLIANAIKYFDTNKKFAYVKIYILVNAEQAIIKVEDNGVGIEPQYLSRIFDRFFRANHAVPGTGMGLFILKDTVDRLNGKVEVSSLKDVGTTFCITLPNLVRPTIL